jgi:hypothetical protein
MRISNVPRQLVIASASIAMLAGCSAGGSQVKWMPGSVTTQSQPVQRLGISGGLQMPTAPNGGDRPVQTSASACPKARVYVASFGSNSVPIYPNSGKNNVPCATITTGIFAPAGVAVDVKGTVYVANYGNELVTEYLRNTFAPSFTFSLGIRPEYIFVGGDKTVYISSWPVNEVLEFAAGAMAPTRTISLPSPFGMATDSKNNLYVAYNGSDGKGHVEKFKPRATTGTDLGINVGYAYDVKVTKNNSLALGDAAAGVVDIYPPGKTSPSRFIPTVTPFSFALNEAETRIYVAPSIPGHGVSIYNFRSGALIGAISDPHTSEGVALDPPAAYDR